MADDTFLTRPAGSTTHITAPYSPAFAFNDDLDVRVRVRPRDDWNIGSDKTMASRALGATAEQSWRWTIVPPVAWPRVFLVDGTLSSIQMQISTPVSGGAEQWYSYRFTLDLDDGAGNRVLTVYERAFDSDPWSIVGAPLVEAGAISLNPGTSALEVLSDVNGSLRELAADVAYLEVYQGIDGALVARLDAADVFGGGVLS